MPRERLYQIGVIILALLLLTSPSLSQTDWTKHGSPILDVGGPSDWDSHGAGILCVLKEGGTYKAWYVGIDAADVGRIGYATSPDGITWVKDVANNPVLDLGSPGSWDDSNVDHASVVKVGSTYHMWFNGEDATSARIGHATSPDGINWTKDAANNPVVDLGGMGDWDESEVLHPAVYHDGVTYHMWYNGFGQSAQRTGYATSPDGVNWTKDDVHSPVLGVGAPGEFDDFMLALQAVIWKDGEYQMWYGGGDGTDGDTKYFRVGYATSPDGFTWTKSTQNPVLDVDPSSAWDSVAVITSAVIYDADDMVYKMWYGEIGDGLIRTGYATSSPSLDVGDDIKFDLPNRYELAQNYPNPFNPATDISFSLPVAGRVRVTVHNILGRKVAVLTDSWYPSGTHTVKWDATGHASGVYFYRLQTDDGFVDTRKMLLVK